MIFKVFFQDTLAEVPVRERTNSLYAEAETEEEVRKGLKDRGYNIEFVTPLSDKALAYEKESNEDFTVESLNK
ncbi:DNA-dependent RNA polymerase subunit epsilon [Alkalicoccus luteus]|uniref:DNA-directed RNA polymerase subunit epsilon n=1 Tax=Alkalicoccus luteus TaxID=1237094 RepID=A0A969PRP5_9BACI|nr:DNA-directed RNA polymerase subunit epsilon [Alkalicoccus luteus]NJP39185.1 DNA-dependent RNA polymerase auxiliary subunit epsilon family protein [Alkalicoccus luteus]